MPAITASTASLTVGIEGRALKGGAAATCEVAPVVQLNSSELLNDTDPESPWPV